MFCALELVPPVPSRPVESEDFTTAEHRRPRHGGFKLDILWRCWRWWSSRHLDVNVCCLCTPDTWIWFVRVVRGASRGGREEG